MRRAWWIGFAVVAFACDAGPPAKPIDACSVLTQSVANSFFGNTAVEQPSGGAECVWSYEAADHTKWSLQLRLHDLTTARVPDIVVTKPTITIDGVPEPDAPIVEDLLVGTKRGSLDASNSDGVAVHWRHDARYFVHLKLTGPAAAGPASKIEVMKRLAVKIEAALPG